MNVQIDRSEEIANMILAFEQELLDPTLLYYYSPHIIERDINAVYLETNTCCDAIEFICLWRHWKKKQCGLPYSWGDTKMAVEAAKLARAALNHGILTTAGLREDRLIWLSEPNARLYERNSHGGGRLILPPCERGARLNLSQRHAAIARPIARKLLDDIAEHSEECLVPDEWHVVKRGFPILMERTISQSRAVLLDLNLHQDIQTQIKWLFSLRSLAVRLNVVSFNHTNFLDNDLDALRSLARVGSSHR